MTEGLLLALETSCDETAAALISSSGIIVHEELYSHAHIHEPLGGIVPEIQARAHLPKLSAILERMLEESPVELDQVSAFAACCGPGLVGSLMCGAIFARSLAWRFGKRFYAVNHLEGHILSPLLAKPDIQLPYLVILASGGHTLSALVDEPGAYRELGTTRDDALGEVFDKVGAMLGLSYPQGPKLESLAKSGDQSRFELPSPMFGDDSCDFSFSGLKSACRRIISSLGDMDGQTKADLAASFSRAASRAVADRARAALDHSPRNSKVKGICLAGGVAANEDIRHAISSLARSRQLGFYAPPIDLCTDNARMIAFAAWNKMKRNPEGDSLNHPIRPVWSLTSS